MNHFAHLVLAQATVESAVGNLLGDFAKGVDTEQLPDAIYRGLLNHRAVDRFTDNHQLVTGMRKRFSEPRRRFAGIALDIYFDHLLLKHWSELEPGDSQQKVDSFYRYIHQGQEMMPSQHMRDTTSSIIKYDWFGSYRDLDGIAQVLDRVAARIRFKNKFENSIQDILANADQISEEFLAFYPELKAHIADLAIELEP